MVVFRHFGDITTHEFLEDYWQKKPLLIRQAFPDFQAPLDLNEIAGLALEESVESRLILEGNKQQPWQLKHGPFSEQDLTSLPQNGWSLLVQGLDTLFPEFSDLLKCFHFLPSWRIDDLMASVAPDGGSVGPHFDYYDVFLLQATGKRQWKLGGFCNHNTPLLAGTDLRIINEFKAAQEFLLEPGDMLYVPPKMAHWGIAQGESTTYSIGFRAPKLSEIISEYCDSCLEDIDTETFFTDPIRQQSLEHGEITSADIDTVKNILSEKLIDSSRIAHWFGSYVTKTAASADRNFESSVSGLIDSSSHYRFELDCRRAFYRENGKTTLFVNGQKYECSLEAAIIFSEKDVLTPKSLAALLVNKEDNKVLGQLISSGYLNNLQET